MCVWVRVCVHMYVRVCVHVSMCDTVFRTFNDS